MRFQILQAEAKSILSETMMARLFDALAERLPDPLAERLPGVFTLQNHGLLSARRRPLWPRTRCLRLAYGEKS